MEWWRRWYFLWGGDSVGAAILFYTRLPWPPSWPVNFDRIARWITLMGLLLSLILLALDRGLHWLGMDNLLQSAVVVSLWLALTGGLHLDGVADTADGLAVTNPSKRLAVMQDSYTGINQNFFQQSSRGINYVYSTTGSRSHDAPPPIHQKPSTIHVVPRCR